MNPHAVAAVLGAVAIAAGLLMGFGLVPGASLASPPPPPVGVVQAVPSWLLGPSGQTLWANGTAVCGGCFSATVTLSVGARTYTDNVTVGSTSAYSAKFSLTLPAGSYAVSASAVAHGFPASYSGSSPSAVLVVPSNVPPPPGSNAYIVASFTSDQTAGTLSVSFTDTSAPFSGATPQPSKDSWTFGDSSSPASGSPVSHAYAAPGVYTVTLYVTASDPAGNSVTNWTTSSVRVATPTGEGAPYIDPSFTWTSSNLTVSLSDTSTVRNSSSETYLWSFGDGGSATGAQPTHTYAAPGTYPVTEHVEVTGPLGTVASSIVLNVTVGTGGSGCAPSCAPSHGAFVLGPLNGALIGFGGALLIALLAFRHPLVAVVLVAAGTGIGLLAGFAI